MISQRKSYKETQLEKQIEQLKAENQRLQDCILLQKKIIEKERKQKFSYDQQFRKSENDETFRSLKLRKNKKINFSDQFDHKFVKCLTSRDNSQCNQTPKLYKFISSKNDSLKTTEQQMDDSMRKSQNKKRLLTVNDLKESQHSNSSTCLYRPKNVVSNTHKKGYIQELAAKITKE